MKQLSEEEKALVLKTLHVFILNEKSAPEALF
jgi:hypothetical protein